MLAEVHSTSLFLRMPNVTLVLWLAVTVSHQHIQTLSYVQSWGISLLSHKSVKTGSLLCSMHASRSTFSERSWSLSRKQWIIAPALISALVSRANSCLLFTSWCSSSVWWLMDGDWDLCWRTGRSWATSTYLCSTWGFQTFSTCSRFHFWWSTTSWGVAGFSDRHSAR